jgi:hypothetical protein
MTHEESIRLARHEAETIDRLIEDHGSEWLDNTGIGLRGWWTPDAPDAPDARDNDGDSATRGATAGEG